MLGISNSASYCKFIGNYVHNIPAPNSSEGGAGIDTWSYDTTGNIIIDNVVDDIGISPNYTVHGIYVCDANETIQNNIAYGNSGWGITTWHAATNVIVANNLVFANGEGGILLGDGDAPGGVTCDNSVVSNNIAIYNQGTGGEGYGISEQGASGLNNLYLNNLVYGNSSGGFALSTRACGHRNGSREPEVHQLPGQWYGELSSRSWEPVHRHRYIPRGTRDGHKRGFPAARMALVISGLINLPVVILRRRQ